MIYGSVCSGIEAASVAWEPLGWKPAFFSEIDKFPSALLRHHYPSTPNYGDLNEFRSWPESSIDLLVGGTPCQSFSVAGLRAGMEDPRGNLALVYLALAALARPKWIVWENVPGVLSSHGGRDFGSFVGALAELGYGWAYRVMDAQHFGVPQRRRRVFVVGYLGDWRRAAAVLFEPEGMQRHSRKSVQAQQEVAGTLGGSSQSGGFQTIDLDNNGAFIVFDETQITHPENRCNPQPGDPSHLLVKSGRAPSIAFNIHPSSGQGAALEAVETEHSTAISAVTHGASIDRGTRIVSFKPSHYTRDKDGAPSETCPPLTKETDKGDQDPVLWTPQGIRRLTPRECERLQGFPDDYTLVDYNGKPAKDSPRYKALGNSMAVPCMRWIGERIARLEETEPS